MKRIATCFLVVALVVAGVGMLANRVAYGDRSLPGSVTTVVIPRGATAADAARELANRGVIAWPAAFVVLARLTGEQRHLGAGEYRFPAHLTLDEVLHRVAEGGAPVAIWVTIPEGYTARQIAQTLAGRGIGRANDFERYFRSTSLDLGNAGRTRNLEGYLFPETYLIPVDASPATVAAMMTGEFREQLPGDAVQRARRLHLSVPQVVTVASLIEREAKANDERSLMAGVYYNRLRRGMPLQVDATIEYTFARHKDVILLSDLQRDSPYNTYRRQGLPPTPIANPGRASLVAAFDPEPSPFLYYVYKGNGHHVFSRTLAEHEANVARYLR